MSGSTPIRLTDEQLSELKKWNTPTVFNGWEQITSKDMATECFNLEPCHDFMPEMGSMIGYAVTVKIEPSNPEHKEKNNNAWFEFRSYLASVDGPKIVVVQDMDKPQTYGAFWGEVNSTISKTLGCVGTITDGAIRDVDEMRRVGFKAIARRMCVGHAHNCPVSWNHDVEVFGVTVKPGQLIHADKHGFLIIPNEDQLPALLEAVKFADDIERSTQIDAALKSAGKPAERILANLVQAANKHAQAIAKKFNRQGEF